jgi:hypothetical protein
MIRLFEIMESIDYYFMIIKIIHDFINSNNGTRHTYLDNRIYQKQIN